MISPVDNTPPLTVNKRNVPHESNDSNKQIKLDYAQPVQNVSCTPDLSMNSSTNVTSNPSFPLPYSMYPSMMMRYPEYTQTSSMPIQIYSSFWDEQKTNILQLEFKGHIVTKRLDNNMVNGTKLLNLTGVTRGKRDSLLKQETERHVIKTGAMHLKGVWLPVKRAYNLARDYGILNIVYPLFQNHMSKATSAQSISQKVNSGPSSNFGSLASPQTPRMLESSSSQPNVTYFPLSSTAPCVQTQQRQQQHYSSSIPQSLSHARMFQSNPPSSSCSIVSPVSTYEPSTDPSYPFQWQSMNPNFEDFFCTKTGLFRDPSSTASSSSSSTVKSSLQPALGMTGMAKKSNNDHFKLETSAQSGDLNQEASNICADIDLFFNAPNDEEGWYVFILRMIDPYRVSL